MLRLSKPQPKYEVVSYKLQTVGFRSENIILSFAALDKDGNQIDVHTIALDESDGAEFIKCGVCEHACEYLKKVSGIDGTIE